MGVSMNQDLRNVLSGFAIGAANVIPGVSGGTIAVTLGIYERLIESLRRFDVSFFRKLLARQWSEAATQVDLRFLAGVGVGVVGSLLTLAQLLKIAFVNYPVPVWAFFFGLIFASVFSVMRLVRRWTPSRWAFFLAGCGVAVALGFLTPASQNAHPIYLLLCGVAAMCSMIVPGISGSFVLLLMGNYKLVMLDSVSALAHLQFTQALPVLIPVGIGAVVGLLALSHLMSWLFRHYHDIAVAMIGGFVLGSLMIIWPWKVPGRIDRIISAGGKVKEKVVSWEYQWPDFALSETWLAFALIVAGVVLVVIMERVGDKNKEKKASS